LYWTKFIRRPAILYNQQQIKLIWIKKMTHLWAQTIDVNADIASKLIEAQHHLPVEAITLLDEGWDNLVFLVNQELIFRFPRREFGVVCIENEINILPFISKNISFHISNPEWIGQPCELYPYHYAGYRLLPGKPLCDATENLISDFVFAQQLANWLSELHSIPVVEGHAKLIKGDQDWRLNVNHRIARCVDNVNRYNNFFEQAGFDTKNLVEIINSLNQLNLHSEKKCYLHGDLYSRHIIVNEQLLPVGLIDWGDLHIGPPGIDLAVGMIFTEEILPVFLEAYGNLEAATIHISLFHAFCHSISFLPYAYEQNKQLLKRWAQLALSRAMSELIKL
jgi:aminoglycoside phosphotransferase (APT) family kinase protein